MKLLENRKKKFSEFLRIFLFKILRFYSITRAKLLDAQKFFFQNLSFSNIRSALYQTVYQFILKKNFFEKIWTCALTYNKNFQNSKNLYLFFKFKPLFPVPHQNYSNFPLMRATKIFKFPPNLCADKFEFLEKMKPKLRRKWKKAMWIFESFLDEKVVNWVEFGGNWAGFLACSRQFLAFGWFVERSFEWNLGIFRSFSEFKKRFW